MMEYHQPLLKLFNKLKLFKKYFLPGIHKLNDSVPEKKQGNQTQFSPKKTLVKENWICSCLTFLLSHQLMDRVIEKSIHKFYNNFFHLSQNFYHTMKKRH